MAPLPAVQCTCRGATALGMVGHHPKSRSVATFTLYLDDVPWPHRQVAPGSVKVGFHPVEADHLPTCIKVSPLQTFPQPGP